jgi:rhodanese-related sulfurtransferase
MSKIVGFNSLLILLILGIFIYFAYIINFQDTETPQNLKISVSEARARRFGLIIDVRPPKERDVLGYYPNSIPIPLDTILEEVPLDISNKNTWILVYSNGDSRAKMAAEALYRKGYKNVRYINETYNRLMPGATY